MSRKKIASRLLVTFIWLGIVVLLRWSWRWNLILLGLGASLGTFLLDVDHWLYLLVINPQELTSMRLKRLLEQRQHRAAFDLVTVTGEERTRLSFHNALFQIAFYPFCFFILTSTGSLFGAGLVMSMALHLLWDEIKFILQGREERLREWLFWPLKTQISLQNQKFFVIIMILLFVGLSLLLV